MAHRPFRFGVVVARARSGEEWAEQARRDRLDAGLTGHWDRSILR